MNKIVNKNQLQESELRFKTLFESSSDAIMTLEPPSWRFTSGNPACIKMFKAKNEADFISHGPGDLSPERQPDGGLSSKKAKEMIEMAMKNGSNFFEWTHKRLNGEDFSATVLLTRVEFSEKIFLQATVRDISEQKKNDEKLKELLDRYIAVTNSAKDAIVTADNLGKIVDWNKAATRLFGFSEKEAVGESLSLIIPSEYRVDHSEGISRVNAGGERHVIGKTVNLEGLRKDGSKFPLELSLSEWDVDNKHYFTGIIRDISERKKSEDTLKENEKKYRTLIDSVPLCIKLFDSQGRILSVNKHGCEEHKLTNKCDEDIRNWNFLDCVEEKYRSLVTEKLQMALQGKSSEFDMEHVPGTTTGHWCHSSLTPIKDNDGKITQVLFVSEDITAKKESEIITRKNLENLEKFKDLTIGRELKMVELKKQIEELKKKK